MTDVSLIDSIYLLLETEYVDCLDDLAFGEAVQLQAAYLAGLSNE
jgi:hypothetical protein